MKRFLSVLTLVSGLLVAAGANAAATITVSQVGSNVVAIISGTLNTQDLVSQGTPNVQAGVYPVLGGLYVGSTDPGLVDVYSGATGSGSLGPGGPVYADTGTGGAGSIFGVQGNNIAVPTGFTTGPVSGSSTWNNYTIAGLGLTPGTYTYTWGSGPNVDSLIVIINSLAPAPSNPIPTLSEWAQIMMMLAMIATAGFYGWRMKQR